MGKTRSSLFHFIGKQMAKRSQIEDWAISRKIVKLKREGFSQKQATAIAFRMWRDGELDIPKTQSQIRKERAMRRKAFMALFARRK